jgi:hypothetical protein
MNAAAYPWPPPSVAPTLRLHPLRTLIPLEFFGVLQGLKLTRAYELVDDFRIWPAFNLATNMDGRRKIHLWRGCVEQYQPRRIMPKGKLADIIAAILPPLGNPPPAAPMVRGSDLTFRFCCSHSRIQDLVRAGELREFGRHPRDGQSCSISYASAAKFLETRVVGSEAEAQSHPALDSPPDFAAAPQAPVGGDSVEP